MTDVTPRPKAPPKAAKKRKAVAKVRKTAPAALKAEATRLHSLIVRAEGVCEAAGYPLWKDGKQEFCNARCSCPEFPRKHLSGCTLQCAHIVSRRYANTRTDEANALCLCARHHLHFTVHPVEWGQFVEGHIGRDAYAAIYRKAMAMALGKFDWEAELGRLTARAVELGVKPGEGS